MPILTGPLFTGPDRTGAAPAAPSCLPRVPPRALGSPAMVDDATGAAARSWFEANGDPTASLGSWWQRLADSGWGFPDVAPSLVRPRPVPGAGPLSGRGPRRGRRLRPPGGDRHDDGGTGADDPGHTGAASAPPAGHRQRVGAVVPAV